jgi:hypothetical protein
MLRRSYRFGGPLQAHDPERRLFPQREPLQRPPRQRRSRNTDDVLGIVRCPICGHPLIARQGCQGPYFFCLCVKQRAA